MTILPKCTTVDATNLEPEEIIHMEFDLYSVVHIHGFTSMSTVVCSRTRMIWILPTEYKRTPFRTI